MMMDVHDPIQPTGQDAEFRKSKMFVEKIVLASENEISGIV